MGDINALVDAFTRADTRAQRARHIVADANRELFDAETARAAADKALHEELKARCNVAFKAAFEAAFEPAVAASKKAGS